MDRTLTRVGPTGCPADVANCPSFFACTVRLSPILFSLGIYNTLRFSTVSGGLCSDDTVDSLHAREFRKAFTEAVQNGSHFL